MVRIAIEVWFLFLAVQLGASLFAQWRIKKLRSDNAYNRYVRFMLLCIALNNFLTFLAMIDLGAVSLPLGYIIKRFSGLAVQGFGIIMLSLYLLGLLNGVGWFKADPDRVGYPTRLFRFCARPFVRLFDWFTGRKWVAAITGRARSWLKSRGLPKIVELDRSSPDNEKEVTEKESEVEDEDRP